MRSGYVIKVVAGLAIVAFFLSAAIRTGNVTIPNSGDAGRALTAVALIAWAYDQFLWRWAPKRVRPPKLSGTWKLELTPRKGAKGTAAAPKPGYLSINQTASRIVVARILFDDGESKATTAVLGSDSFGKQLLLFYDFVPKPKTDDNPDRKGAASLTIAESGLEGTYWNDALIRGDLASKGHTGKRYDSYDAARQGTYS